MAAVAAAWSALTVASEAPQDWQVTMDKLLAFLGVMNALLPQAAQASMLGEVISEEDSRKGQRFSEGCRRMRKLQISIATDIGAWSLDGRYWS